MARGRQSCPGMRFAALPCLFTAHGQWVRHFVEPAFGLRLLWRMYTPTSENDIIDTPTHQEHVVRATV